MKILVDYPMGNGRWRTFFTPENIAYLESLGEVEWNYGMKNFTEDELRDKLENVDILVAAWGLKKLEGKVLEKANKLKFVAYMAGSVNGIVSDEMYDRGIRIVGANDAFAESVAEGALTMMLCCQRRVKRFENMMLNEGFRKEHFENEGLFEKKIGIVGYGSIAKNLINMLKPFRPQIYLYSRHMSEEEAAAIGCKKATLEEIFSECRIVSIHSAKSPANYHLVTEEHLNMMQWGALLVNTARGDIIDEKALERIVNTGRIRVALDVFEQEPPVMTSPFRFMRDDCLIQPHMGGPTMDHRAVCARIVFEDIERFQKGEALEHEILPWRAAMMTH